MVDESQVVCSAAHCTPLRAQWCNGLPILQIRCTKGDIGIYLSHREKKSLKNYFIERTECDYLIAIICNGKEKTRNAYEADWGIKTMFGSRYSKDSQWKELLEKQFNSLESESKYLEPIEISVEKPFETTYHFFILERKK